VFGWLAVIAGAVFMARSMQGLGVNETEEQKDTWQPPERAAPYLEVIRETEQAEGLPFNLLARVLYQESRYRADIIDGRTVSSAGAQGIAQIVPRWHPNVNPLDPVAAIRYAGGYLRDLYSMFGNWEQALAAYNWGPGNLSKVRNDPQWLAQAPRETRNYVTQITGDVVV
jgi:soluble lytic murein transglycosylase-like protein